MTIKVGTKTIASTTINASWGSIEGIIDDQVDLQQALSKRAPTHSPRFSGFPLVPTALEDASELQATNIQWVNNRLAELGNLPPQENNGGKFLTTDGTAVSWVNLPSNEDNSTIVKNKSGKFQTVGIIDQNTSTMKNIWVGTQAEYNSATKNTDTIYHITDELKLPSITSNAGKVLSTDGSSLTWVTPKETDISNLVTLDTNQTIDGLKEFSDTIRLRSSTSDISINFVSPNISIDTKPDDTHIRSFRMYDGDYNIISQFASVKSKESGNQETFIEARNNNSGELIQGKISVYATTDGKVTTYAPTPMTTSNSTEIATTNFVDLKIKDVLDKIYPIGSIYLSVTSTNPLQTLGIGTWQLVSSGRVLQGADASHAVGTTIEAGLPQHTHDGTTSTTGSHTHNITQAASDSGFGWPGAGNAGTGTISTHSAGDHYHTFTTGNASNSIYGKSTTVQPPAYVVNVWRRTA